MQIILNEEECEVIYEALIEKRRILLLSISYGKCEDKQKQDKIDIDGTNELIKRFEPYI